MKCEDFLRPAMPNGSSSEAWSATTSPTRPLGSRGCSRACGIPARLRMPWTSNGPSRPSPRRFAGRRSKPSPEISDVRPSGVGEGGGHRPRGRARDRHRGGRRRERIAAGPGSASRLRHALARLHLGAASQRARERAHERPLEWSEAREGPRSRSRRNCAAYGRAGARCRRQCQVRFVYRGRAGPPATSNGRRASSVAFSNLQKAAADGGMTVTEFCAGATHNESGGTTRSTVTTTLPDQSASTTTSTNPHGPPASTPHKVGSTRPRRATQRPPRPAPERARGAIEPRIGSRPE